MAEKENNFYFLESVIKVEPEELQSLAFKNDFRSQVKVKIEPKELRSIVNDDILRSRAGIFSDPSVLLERLTSKTMKSNMNQYDNKAFSSETARELALKGNEGFRFADPHTCCYCQMVLSNRNNLKLHLDTVHCKSKKMSCDLCPKFFFNRKAIFSHMRVHKKKKFTCNVCDFKTAVKYHFEAHKMTHAAKVKCSICKKQVSSLNNHMISHKPKKTCPVCQKVLQGRNFKNHMKTHSKALKCEKCEEIFDSKLTLKRHNLTKHFDKKLFECHCGEVFKHSYLLVEHQQIHKEKMECRVCQKQFSLPHSLYMHWRSNHLETHGKLESTKMKVLNRTGPFICDKCGSWSSSRKSFRVHLLSYHRSFSVFCDLCPRSFTSKGLLALHMKQDHLKLRPFECNVCSYKTSLKRNLNVHMLLHGPKTECKICQKLVTNMYYHLKSHVKVKCLICSKNFSRNTLSKHMKTHGKGIQNAQSCLKGLQKETKMPSKQTLELCFKL